ncbi:MAG: tetratricopeptide repeat protein, partial [Candidatus Cloacimonetes bacterium]|nr:tetratricopeptide repeat protein [Candidatus Cloacimonadota bacterium]
AGGEPDPEIIERIKALQLKLDPNVEPVAFDPDEEVSIWEDVTLTQERKEYRSADRGEELLNEGDLDGAYKEFSAYIKNVPNSVLPYIYRACVNLMAGKLEEAIKDLTGAIECGAEIIPDSEQNPFVAMFSEGTDPRNKHVYLMRALVHALLEKQEESHKDLVGHIRFNAEMDYLQGVWSRHTSNLTAVEALSGVFARTIAEKPEETITPLQNALLALIMDDKESAQTAIEEAVRSDPKNPVNYWARGLSQDELEYAFKDYATATELAGGKAEYFYVQGFKKLLNKLTREGRDDLLKAISLDPNNAEYHEKLGVFLSKSNQHDEAIEHLTKAIELNPDSKDAYFMRGVSLDWKGETEAALEDLEKAITLGDKPGNLKTKTAQEKIQEIRESETKKQALLSKLVSSSERLGSATEYLARGETYLKEAKWEQAYADFNQAIELEPENAEAYRYRGATYHKLGDAKSALKDYNQAIKLDPNKSDLFLNRGILQADSGDSQNALVDLNEAIRLNPSNAMAYHMRARVYSEAWFDGDSIDHALEDFEQAIKLDPNDPEVYVSRAQLWSEPSFPKGKKEALADYNQAIRLAPDNAEYYLARYKIKLSLKDANGASEDLTKAYQLDPSNEEVKALVQKLTAGEDKKGQITQLMMSAMEKINSGDLDGCIADLKQAEKLDPDDQWVKDMLSQIPASLLNGESDLVEDSDISEEDSERANQFVMSGIDKFEAKDYEGCINDLSQAMDLNSALSNKFSVYQMRGLAKLTLEQNEAAIQDFTEAIRLEPDAAIPYLVRSQGFQNIESYDEAIADLNTVLDRHFEIDDDLKQKIFISRGHAYLQKGLFAEVILDSKQAIELKPDEPNGYYNRAEAYKELREFKSAVSDFQTYLEMSDEEEDKEEVLGFIQEMSASLSSDPSLPSTPILAPEPKKVELANAHIVRANELREAYNYEGALEEVKLAKHLIPDEKLPYELAFAIYNDIEDWENGIANLQEVIRVKPDDVMAHVNLGALKTKIGDLDGAIADLINATKLDPNHAQSHLFLGVAYLMQAKYDQAKESFSRSIDLDPSVPVAYLHRASVKEKLKEYPAAIPDFEKYCQLGGSEEVPDLTPLREHITFLKKEFGHMSDADIQLEEHKQKLQKEIDEHNLKLEVLKRETGSEIERLRKERDSLGFLAMGKKKEIDQKIHSLENQFLDFA